MKSKFLSNKEIGKLFDASPQKQECGCPPLQAILRIHTHAFFANR